MTEEVPYREVHDLLERNGWVLKGTRTVGREALQRLYVSKVPGRPTIIFPVSQKRVLRAHYENIKKVIQGQLGSAGGGTQ